MIVLDTNVVSELMRPAPDEAVLAWLDEHRVGEIGLTAVTVAELRFGVERMPAGRRRETMSAVLDGFLRDVFTGGVHAFGAAEAEAYALIVAARERAGRPISMADGQIAAICVCRALTLATRNSRDFDGTGVTLLDPWAAD